MGIIYFIVHLHNYGYTKITVAEIQTFQDSTPMGTFSQIKLDDGNKIFISLTQTEIVIFKVGFFGIPKGTIWKEDIYKFLDIIYPECPDSKEADKSVLEIAVDLATQCQTIDEVKDKFSNLAKNKTQVQSALSTRKPLPAQTASNIIKVDQQKLKEYSNEIFSEMEKIFSAEKKIDLFKKNFNKNYANINPGTTNYCVGQFVHAELDFATPGNRGIGRLTDALPRLGAYFRDSLSRLEKAGLNELDGLITKLILKRLSFFCCHKWSA